MSKKSDYFLLGIILLIIGVYTLIEQFIAGNFGAFAYMIAGASLLFLYHTKRKTWALVSSIPIIMIGLTKVLPYNVNITGALILLVMSAIFITLFYTKSINGFLIPGCILFWIGLYLLIGKFVHFIDRQGFFSLFIGFSFVFAYALGRHCFGKWLLYLGMVIIIFSIFSILGLKPLSLVVFRGPIAISALLIIGSIFFIKKGMS